MRISLTEDASAGAGGHGRVAPVTKGEEQAFHDVLERRLARIAEETSLRAATRAARGLFPVDVKEWFLTHRGHKFLEPEEGGRAAVPDYRPELHILDGEWYFTRNTSERLANMLGAEPSLLLGAPTVAACLPGSGSVLVDRSPFIRDRFPALATAWIREDVSGVRLVNRFRNVLLDPPWNLSELFTWVRRATQALEQGGLLLLPLLGECTRPGADRQRAALLEYLAAAGRLEVQPDAIEYDVPLFEQRTLIAAGAAVDGPWRRADLVRLRVDRPLRASPLPGETDPFAGDWESFLIGTQVVKVRRAPPALAMDPPIAPVPMTNGYTLRHLSRRLIDGSRIDIWTSRNAVGKVLDHALVRAVLEALQGDEAGLSRRVRAVRAQRGDAAREILRLLEF